MRVSDVSVQRDRMWQHCLQWGTNYEWSVLQSSTVIFDSSLVGLEQRLSSEGTLIALAHLGFDRVTWLSFRFILRTLFVPKWMVLLLRSIWKVLWLTHITGNGYMFLFCVIIFWFYFSACNTNSVAWFFVILVRNKVETFISGRWSNLKESAMKAESPAFFISWWRTHTLRLSSLESWLCHLLIVWTWTSYITLPLFPYK